MVVNEILQTYPYKRNVSLIDIDILTFFFFLNRLEASSKKKEEMFK